MRETVHRPILDVEVVGRKLFARCYLGLYAPNESGSFKDITADESGTVHLNHVNQMNLGNPFKAMLWAEDYLVNAIHNADSEKEPPHPVVRSFLVPLEQADALLNGEGDFGKKTRPVDQDRASGQFTNLGDTDAYDHLLTPLAGSLVSFFYSERDFSKAPIKGQTKYSMDELVEFLTGASTDLKDLGSDNGQWSPEEKAEYQKDDPNAKLPPYPKKKASGIAAQYGRAPNDIKANSLFRDSITAYYASLTDTGFTSATDIAVKRKEIDPGSRPKFGGHFSPLNEAIMKLMGIAEPAQFSSFLQAYSLLPTGSVESPSPMPSASASSSAGPDGKSGKTETASTEEEDTFDPLHMYEPVIPAFPDTLFHLADNPGHGDCLFHALEGRILNPADLIRVRAEVAGIRGLMPDTEQEMGLNAQVVAMNLLPIPIIGEEIYPLIQGHHQVPNRILAQLQAIPGVYAGDTEILQWTRLRNQDVYILEQDGTFIHFAPDGTQTTEPAPTLEQISQLLGNVRNVLLYKYSNHWKRIIGLAASPGRAPE